MLTIEIILSRMMNEPAFADSVFADAEKALAEYELSVDEIAKFEDMSRTDFETYASASPEERKSFGSTATVGGSGFFKIRNEGG